MAETAVRTIEVATDEDIVARVRQGDSALFEVLMRRHNARVYRAVRAVLGGDADAEEAMQQAYVSAYTHLAQLGAGQRFGPWLTRIAVNAALGLRRKSAGFVTLEALPGGSEEVHDVSPRQDPERGAAARELVAEVERALEGMAPALRLAFVLREVQGLSTQEAAESLGVSEEALKQRLHRAREGLRASLEARVGEAARDAWRFEAPRCDRVVAGVFARLGLQR